MTTLTLDLDQFTTALTKTVNRTLDWVWLNPTSYVDDEITPPYYVPPVPSVMADFALINNSSYKFDYTGVRYGRFCYLLERAGSYEAGELIVLHDLTITETLPPDELSPPPISPPFTPPTFTIRQTVSIGSVESLGVLFTFKHDYGTDGSTSKFGLAYKITNASPPVYPRLTMSYVTALTPEIDKYYT